MLRDVLLMKRTKTERDTLLSFLSKIILGCDNNDPRSFGGKSCDDDDDDDDDDDHHHHHHRQHQHHHGRETLNGKTNKQKKQ